MTLADIRAGAERAYERWMRTSRDLCDELTIANAKLRAERDGLKADINSSSAQLNEAYDVIRKDRGEAQAQFNTLEQQLRAARELRDEACSERDSLVIERDKALKRWDELQLAFTEPKPVSAAPKDGTLVWCLIPARWDGATQAFRDRANIWVADDHARAEVVTWLPRKDGS